MPWETSDRRQGLPANWEALRRACLDRDGWRCTWRLPSGNRCPRRATDVDHKDREAGDGLWNLRALCPHHHGKKSSGEGRQARAARKAKGRRPPERHPGDR